MIANFCLYLGNNWQEIRDFLAICYIMSIVKKGDFKIKDFVFSNGYLAYSDAVET